MRSKNRFRYPILAIVAVLCWSLFIVLCHNDCSTPGGLPKPLLAAAEMSIEDALVPPVTSKASPLMLTQSDPPWLEVPTGPGSPITNGHVRLMHGHTACQSPIPLPCIVSQDDPPIVGRDWACTFATSSCEPFPDWDCWILISHQPLRGGSIDFTPYNMPGCWLHVNPDQLTSVPVGFAGSPMLTRQGGQITMHYTPPPIMAGRMFWMQLLVKTPTNLVSSHGIEVLVGY